MKTARFVPLIALLLAGMAACNKAETPPVTAADENPADGNLAPVQQAAPADSGSQPVAEEEPQATATDAPPPLPEYSQPPAPGDNYLWTPGYWDYSVAGYYWVPGAWVMAPWLGALWTPPYWGYQNGAYRFHAGYWGSHIGFYGGIDYGFGYPGRGYYGAYWNHGQIFYNRTVTNVDTATVRNYYAYTAPRGPGNRVSYQGGHGGMDARPTAQEAAALREPRIPPVAAQLQHAHSAAADRGQFAAPGRQQPASLAAGRPLETEYRSPASLPPARVPAPSHPSPEIFSRPNERPAEPAARPQVPESRQMPAARPAEQQPRVENRPAPVARPTEQQPPREQGRPAPVARPTEQQPPREQGRPAPVARPTEQQPPREQGRPAPVARPAEQQPPRVESRPAPAARPAEPAARPVQTRPAPENHPQPQPRPAPPEEKKKQPGA